MVGCGAIPETVGGNMAAVLSNKDQQEHTAEGGGDHTEVHSGWSVVNVNARGLDATLEEAERLWHDGRLQDTMTVLSALLEGSEELDNYRGDKGLLLTRTAILYEEMGDIAKALEYHFKHLELALKQSFSEGSKAQIRCYDNISFLYLKQGKDMLFRTYLEKAAETKREMLRVEAESRKPSRALSDAEEREKKQETQRQEAEMERKRDKREKAEREKEERLNVENEGLIELIDALKVPLKKRDESDVYKILCALDPIEYLQKRTNEHQRRELARLVKYETHVEAFDMYMPGDPADRAWIILGCTPFLEDYKGSVDVMEWDEAIKAEKVVGRVHYGNLFGQDALDGAERRKNHVVVSDDGHDDVITTNHFLTIMRSEFEEIINTYYHDCFQVYPGTEVLDCKYANLFDDGAGELSWFLINSRNNVLKSLDLQYNNIGPEGAHRIADLMANNYAITSIEMSNNHIGDLGVTGLCKALSSNTALISLSLRANQITNRSGPGLQGLLDMNTILTCVDLKENSICYAEAVAQLSEYAINHNYHVRYDHDNDLTLLKLAQSRDRRAKEEAEYAKRSETSRGLSAASTYGSSSTVDGWTVRRKRYGQFEESYSREETEAVLKRIGLALRDSLVYQRRLNKDGPGVLRRECLVTDVSKRRTMAQPIFIETLWHFDIKVSADDAAVLAACFGYTPYVFEESLSSSRATTAASGARPRRTGAHTATSTRTREGSLTTGKQTGKTALTPSTAHRRSGSRSEISRVLGTISSASSNASEARNSNKILIVWPYVIQVLEGNCQKHIEEFGVFEKLDRSSVLSLRFSRSILPVFFQLHPLHLSFLCEQALETNTVMLRAFRSVTISPCMSWCAATNSSLPECCASELQQESWMTCMKSRSSSIASKRLLVKFRAFNCKMT